MKRALCRLTDFHVHQAESRQWEEAQREEEEDCDAERDEAAPAVFVMFQEAFSFYLFFFFFFYDNKMFSALGVPLAFSRTCSWIYCAVLQTWVFLSSSAMQPVGGRGARCTVCCWRTNGINGNFERENIKGCVGLHSFPSQLKCVYSSFTHIKDRIDFCVITSVCVCVGGGVFYSCNNQ